MTALPAITLIGCGKMGGALVRGWADGASAIDIVEPHGYAGDAHDKITVYTNIAALPVARDVIVLAVKPQVMADVCAALKDKVAPGALILSIAAGQKIANFENYFGAQQPIVRAMPNTPAAIGKGITVLVANAHVTPTQKNHATALLAAAGKVEWVDDEALMDAVTAVSGSGPAYIFHMIEALADAGTASGLTPDFAMKLARQTVIGAAALAESDADINAATLRKNVTSPGGTTEAGLKILMDHKAGLKDLMTRTVDAATKRGKELGNS